MEHSLLKGVPIGAVALVLLLGACSSPSSFDSGGEAQARADVTPPEPDLPLPEITRDRNRRLLRLEQALDNWYVADVKQEYGRKESLEQLLLEFCHENGDSMISDLKNGSVRFRRVMAAGLGFSSDPRAVPPLMEALDDSNYEVVVHALLSLYHLTRPDSKRSPKEDSPRGAWDNPAGVLERKAIDPQLVSAERIASFLQHHQSAVRCNAALAVRPLVGPGKTSNSVLLALINSTEDTHDRTRMHAIAALGATGSPEAIPHLVKALSDQTALARIRAGLGLARIGDVQVTPYLIEVLARETEPVEVRHFMAQSLAHLLGVKGADANSVDPERWKKIAEERGIRFGG